MACRGGTVGDGAAVTSGESGDSMAWRGWTVGDGAAVTSGESGDSRGSIGRMRSKIGVS